jgi:hypothetical protein
MFPVSRISSGIFYFALKVNNTYLFHVYLFLLGGICRYYATFLAVCSAIALGGG